MLSFIVFIIPIIMELGSTNYKFQKIDHISMKRCRFDNYRRLLMEIGREIADKNAILLIFSITYPKST